MHDRSAGVGDYDESGLYNVIVVSSEWWEISAEMLGELNRFIEIEEEQVEPPEL